VPEVTVLLRLILALMPAVLAAALVAAPAARAAPFKSERVEIDLVAQDRAAVPGRTTTVGLRIRQAPGWHTYWRNSGDAGLPPDLKWTLPDGWSFDGVVWPAPGRMPEGGGALMTYGWEGEVILPLRFTVPAHARGSAPLAVTATVLVCAHICVPEVANLALDLPIADSATPNGPEGQAVMRAVSAAPVAEPSIRSAARMEDGRLKLAFVGPPLAGQSADGAYFYPDRPGVIRHAAVQTIEKGPQGLTLTLERASGVSGPLDMPVSGVLSTRAGSWAVSVAPAQAPEGAAGQGAATPAPASSVARGEGDPRGEQPGGLGLPFALLLALAGGLLLNLMPCVFPVLAMKAAALARHIDEPGEGPREGLAFTAGVLATFLGLALALLAAKAAGEAAGWGFQLQSPFTIAALALVMLGVGLNLSGVFHVGLSLQGAGSWNRHSGALGAFLTGALAVVVAAPCFAPFMTEAVSFGLTHGPVEAVLVFLALGLGFSIPFLALSLAPSLSRRLPRPGPWMETLKQLLAFPMYAAAAWLAWVFAQQAGTGGLGLLLLAAVLLALAFHLLGRAQAAQAEGRRPLAGYIGAAIALVIAGFTAAAGAATPAPDEAGVEGPGGLEAVAWSPEALAAARAEGRPVFVNFTAAWCVTCQVNERAALHGARVREAFQRTRAVYMVADWTRRDAAIAGELAAHGRAGVPLYLVYGTDGGEPAVLPQLLSADAVVRALEAADRE